MAPPQTNCNAAAANRFPISVSGCNNVFGYSKECARLFLHFVLGFEHHLFIRCFRITQIGIVQ